MTRVMLLLVLAATLLYGGVETYPLIAGPSLALSSPLQGASDDGVVTIAGKALRTVTLTVDGEPLLPDRKGSFSKTLAFARGSTILTVIATDRFGRSVTKTRTIVVP